METLVIHPCDLSTHFLKSVYEGNPNYEVITGDIPKLELMSNVEQSNNLLIMGHGTKDGLLGYNFNCELIIDSSFCGLLQNKNCILLFCNADEFINNNNLIFNGIYCGNFISEAKELVSLDSRFETEDYATIQAYQPMIDESNIGFAKILGKLLKENKFEDTSRIFENLKLEYLMIAKRNEVASYNYDRLYFNNLR